MDEGQVIDDIVADKLERYQEILIEDEEEELLRIINKGKSLDYKLEISLSLRFIKSFNL